MSLSKEGKEGQTGLGLIEVLVASALLALIINGGIFASARWFSTINEVFVLAEASRQANSSMELAAFRCDSSWILEEMSHRVEAEKDFSISAACQTGVSAFDYKTIQADISWFHHGTHERLIRRNLRYEGAVSSGSVMQAIGSLVLEPIDADVNP